MTQAIDSQTVIQYLLAHPDFFEHHADILPEMQLTSPVIGKAISLHERQIEVLRSRNKAQELQLSSLMHNARENRQLMDKLLDWACRLIQHRQDADMPRTIIDTLKSTFNVPDANLRLWDTLPDDADRWFAQPVDETVRQYASDIKTPFCGRVTLQTRNIIEWLANPADIRSAAIIPLSGNDASIPFGLLVLGSPDATRFQNAMATDFLSLIGKLAAASLAHLVKAD